MKKRETVAGIFFICHLASMMLVACRTAPTQKENNRMNAPISQNSPEKIREMIGRMKGELDKDPDRFPDLILELEQTLGQTTSDTDKAILHSMAAEMYNRYLQQTRWTISQRTAVSGYVPDDIREWSPNLFDEKIKEHLTLSLQPARLLQQTPVSLYEAMLEKESNPVVTTPTLYDFLIQRAIRIQPSDEFYQQWLSFRNTDNNRKATLLVELDYLKYNFQKGRGEAARKNYQQSLDSLLNTYHKEDFSTEIRIAQVEILDQIRYGNDSIIARQYQILKEGINLYPNYERTAVLRNRLKQIENAYLSVQVPQTVYPGKEIPISINYQNIKKITVRLHESGQQITELTAYQVTEEKQGKLIRESSFTLDSPYPYTTQDTILYVPGDKNGLYELAISVPGEEIHTTHIISVSTLAAAIRPISKKQEVLVTDYESGKPIANATVNYFGGKRRNLNKIGEVKTDKNGIAVLPESEIFAFQATLPGDTLARLTTLYPTYKAEINEDSPIEFSLFTDRGIYRPGQTLFFKGIVYQLKKDQAQIIPNKTYTVILRDGNDQEISKQELKTNEFGSFNGEFILPSQVLTGSFSISIDNRYTYFQVEEYKRPTFAVKIQPIREEIAFGDLVKLTGEVQTLSGVALQQGEVSWRIVRRPYLLRIGYGNFGEEQVANGETSVSPDGNFTLTFRPERVEGEISPWQYYKYELVAVVTDNKGESQNATLTFPVGDTSLTMTVDLPPKADRATVKATVKAQLLNGEKTTVKGQYQIHTLVSNDEKASDPDYQIGKRVTSGEFVSDTALPSGIFASLSSGRYRITLEAKDKKGREVKNTQDFILYDRLDKKPPVFSREWLVNDNIACLPGETAEWTYGTSLEQVYLLYEIYQGNRMLHRERMLLNNEIRTFKLPFKEEYGDGVSATFTFVKEGELYVTQIRINRKQPDRKLTIRPKTFRDRLLPGNDENWEFRITDADSLAVTAEVLASLYDQSLDQILPYSWYFSPQRSIYLQAPRFNRGDGFGLRSQYASAQPEMEVIKTYLIAQIDWQGVLYGWEDRVFYSTRTAAGTPNARMKSSASMDAAQDGISGYGQLAEPVITGAVTEDIELTAEQGNPNQRMQSALRTNFNETAFFFPTLRTDKEGNVIVKFKMPESTTTWKFQMIAHTKQLKYGQHTAQIITSKPLMVLPNLPRFLRQGDRLTLSTQIFNQSENGISGKARLEWFDPATEEVIRSMATPDKDFTLMENGQTSVQWTLTVPNDRELIGCRIIADSDAGSDGEQHLLPILSNQILLTESAPFYLKKQGEQRIEIPQVPGVLPLRLTIEASANPIWYAVQALPTLITPSDDNVLSWFASYYSNTLATSIANSAPRIKQVIERWKAEGGNAETLFSNMEKNEELKNILLQETPWVMQAQNETEQKQRLYLLFDLNRAASQREAAMRQVLELQKEDGGWAWFKGFYPNRDITLAILKGMSQLVQLSATQYNQEEKEMQMRALRYLDGSIQKDYEDLKKYSKSLENTRPTDSQMEFLYVRSFYRDIPELGEAREAIRFYTNQAETQWKELSLLGKGQAAILMYRNGKKEVAAEIINWLRQTATISEEQGMYWANNRRGQDFFHSPVDVHTLLMAAFQEITSDKEETDLMKQWLLNQKRTQEWESTPATINAIYMLLLTGSDWLGTENTITVHWGGKEIRSTDGEPAIGYLKETLTGDGLSHQTDAFTLSKKGDAPAWGAVYNQYFAAIDQVKAQKGVLNVEKKLFIEKNNGKEREIHPVSENQLLKVGDKAIVRLTIRTDRDMDYVYLKDLRSGAFEPADQLSGSNYQDGVWFYRAPKDASENFYFQRLPKGTFVIEYPVYVSRSGQYAGGISTIQCLYAPEFVSHTEGGRITVND